MTAENKLPILLVDDNSAHRKLIRRAINKAGIQNPIFEADSLAEARNLVTEIITSKEAPAVAIIDLNLGDGRGTHLIAELRKNPKFQTLHIIVLSTSALKSDVDESYRVGANCYITKTDDIMSVTKEIANGIRAVLK